MCVATGSRSAFLLPHALQTSLGSPRAVQGKISFLSFVPKPRRPLFSETSLNILVPYYLRKSPWSLNCILTSQRWNRINFVNTEEKLWVIQRSWPYAGADWSISREVHVPGGKHKSVKKQLWNKIMFYLETGQKVWLNIWSIGMGLLFSLNQWSLCVPALEIVI